ncbi:MULTISPECIES: 2TM domain-containing protein [Dyadobacter]|jgi:hypothetical protein|uniref:2TM domain-containing protein n=1 Tax=Dyadobacter chenhuakuii TaxID=2909339 RepID=A0A9X1QBD1_9BACT|nr:MULTISPECIES: 2TM domain-containing protein [Dyadobacter]MCE7069718.1 2TM domain-containing protein [Dyadobacter sp. CY327]MCF2492043.1 2TM domain-containing protein [Dyadobacter chenhuakuii]MCF2498600.1 2TM domain-containing protein [Dyadobacter chenhuakuii]MCF2516680.1 2TM domain-containing protein [Dyadobacter sp. CY351]USJ28796.1 2TM domain-containing protein [Dyadobacter chenhuakuii]
METPRNEFIWRKAKKRASFKVHLSTYMVVNGGLWLLWAVTAFPHFGNDHMPWPIFPMLGWGIGLASHYITAYGNLGEKEMAEREYEKLMRS